MKEIKKNTRVKLRDNRIVEIVNLPTTFMSNGSYEVVNWINDDIGSFGKSFWVRPEEILREVNPEWEDDLNNYFEIIFDEEGLHMVPKNIELIKIEEDVNGTKKIVITYPENKHKILTMYVGETTITDEHDITEGRPEEPNLIDKVKDIIVGEE
jgi:hypothetical protein